MIQLPANRQRFLQILTLLLVLPALLINLGLPILIDDEAIRLLVAREMVERGNYIVPTLHDAFYYNKPPLFNWIIIGFHYLFGSWEDWVGRLPTIAALLGYSATIYMVFRRAFNARIGWWAAAFFLTCGRILFWDSMLALIDITFSWVVFISFIWIYYWFERKQYWYLFIGAYLCCAIGFMFKGLPAIVFQGLTLISWFAWNRRWRAFFHPAHFIAGFMCLGIWAVFYWVYAQHNDQLDVVFKTLFTESSKRTAAQFGIKATIIHLFTYPFEMLYHFVPWSLGVLYLIRRDIWTLLRKNRFILFLTVVFLANSLPYWTSVEVYPRYLLMLAPLIFGVFAYLHPIHKQERSLAYRILEKLFWGVTVLVLIASPLPLFWDRLHFVPHIWPKTLLLIALLALLNYLYWKWAHHRWSIFIAVLLVVRIAFNWYVLPDRLYHDYGAICWGTSVDMGKQFKDVPLYVHECTDMQPTNSFYLTRSADKLIPYKTDGFQKGDIVIIDPKERPEVSENWEQVGHIAVRHGRQSFYLFRVR